MQSPIFSALSDIAAIGKAAATVPVMPPPRVGPPRDDVCAKLLQKMDDRSREMAAPLARTAAQLEPMIFDPKIGLTEKIGEG